MILSTTKTLSCVQGSDQSRDCALRDEVEVQRLCEMVRVAEN